MKRAKPQMLDPMGGPPMSGEEAAAEVGADTLFTVLDRGVTKHLGPRHDQKDHGRKGTGTQTKLFDPTAYAREPSPGTGPHPVPEGFDVAAAFSQLESLRGTPDYGLTETAIRNHLANIFTATFEQSGLSTTVDPEAEVYINLSWGVSVSGSVLDGNGEQVGRFERSIDFMGDEEGGYATNERLELNPSAQGKNFATEFNSRAFDAYREMGLTHVKVHADIDVGGYAWAKEGFDFDPNQATYSIESTIETTIADLRTDPFRHDLTVAEAEPIIAQLEHALENLPEHTPLDLAMIGHDQRKGKNIWVGKAMMLGSDWYGVFHL